MLDIRVQGSGVEEKTRIFLRVHESLEQHGHTARFSRDTRLETSQHHTLERSSTCHVQWTNMRSTWTPFLGDCTEWVQL